MGLWYNLFIPFLEYILLKRQLLPKSRSVILFFWDPPLHFTSNLGYKVSLGVVWQWGQPIDIYNIQVKCQFQQVEIKDGEVTEF